MRRRVVLYDAAQFEPLTDEPWADGRVRDAIAAIVADADAAFDRESLWPVYDWDGWEIPRPATMPGAPVHHWRRMVPSALTSVVLGAPGQFARPSSRKAVRASTSAMSEASASSGSSRSRASVLPAPPCSVPRPR